MRTHWILAAALLTNLANATAITPEDDPCGVSLKRLHQAIQASPEVLSTDVEAQLAHAMGTCSGSDGGGPATKSQGKGLRFLCRSGSLQGAGPLEVIIAAPPLGIVRYREVALETYDFVVSGGTETHTFTARAGSSLGFDAVMSTSSAGWGTIYFAGSSFTANEWDVNGACNRHRASPCAGSGYAAYAGTIEVWMFGYLAIC